MSYQRVTPPLVEIGDRPAETSSVHVAPHALNSPDLTLCSSRTSRSEKIASIFGWVTRRNQVTRAAVPTARGDAEEATNTQRRPEDPTVGIAW